MKLKYRSFVLASVLTCCLALVSGTRVLGQTTGGGGTGGGADGGTGGGTQVPVANPGTGTGTNTGTGFSEIPDFSLDAEIPVIESERVQPFVGPSQDNIVHPLSQDASGGGAGGGGGGGFTLNRGGRGGAAGQGGFGTGSEFSFTVPRKSIRAILRNRIIVPNSQFRDTNTSSRFQQRMVSIPSMRNVAGVRVSVSQRRATLTGNVATLQQKQLVERMARLEPGIYTIDNQITVGTATSSPLPTSRVTKIEN